MDLPIKIVIFHSFLYVYQRVNGIYHLSKAWLLITPATIPGIHIQVQYENNLITRLYEQYKYTIHVFLPTNLLGGSSHGY